MRTKSIPFTAFLLILFAGKIAYAQPKVITTLVQNKGCIYQTVSLSVQNPPAGTTSYYWDFFGDTTATSTTTLPQVQFYYNRSGAFKVRVKATTSSGPVTTYSDSVYIYNLPDADFVTTNGTKFCNGAQVCFEDRSTPAIPLPGHPVASLTTRLVLYGDGGIYTQGLVKNFCYTYIDPSYSTYTVTWRITDANGCKDTLRRPGYIYVVGDLGAKFTVSAPLGISLCPPVQYTDAIFTNTTTAVTYPDSVKSFRWTFGDPANPTYVNTTNWSSNGTLTYRYHEHGTSYPRLILEDWNGCRDTFIYNTGIKNTNFYPWAIKHPQNPVCANPGMMCWKRDSIPGATKEWTFYVNPNPPFNPATGLYTLGQWKPLSVDPKIFKESGTFAPCRALPCGMAITSLELIPPGGNTSCANRGVLLFEWDTVEVLGPKAVIEVAGSNATAIADSMRYQCKVGNTVHFPNNSCHYKAFHVVRLWNFGDKYARQCTTDKKKNINVSGHDTLSLLDPVKYPPGSSRPCNCNFSKDSLPSHTYTDWDTLALRSVQGNTFISTSGSLYTSKNFPPYEASLSLYDSVNKCGDTDRVKLSLGAPKAGPEGSLLTANGHTRVVMPGVNYGDNTSLKKSGMECFGNAPNGIIFDLSGTVPSSGRGWVAMNFDSAAGISFNRWQQQPGHFSQLNNQGQWSPPGSPKPWPNTIAHNYLDPPGIIDYQNGWVTIGLVVGNGYTSANGTPHWCYDTAYYHNFIRFTPYLPEWDFTDASGNVNNAAPRFCVAQNVYLSLRHDYQDSILVVFYNWDDGSYDVDSILRPGYRPSITTYTRTRYQVNTLGQVLSQQDLSNLPDSAVGVPLVNHSYKKGGRFFPSVTVVNTAGCSDYHFRELVNTFYAGIGLKDTVICPGDSLILRDSVYYWILPMPFPPQPDKVYYVGRDPYLGGRRSTPPIPPYQFETLKWRILKRDTSNGKDSLVGQVNGALPQYGFDSPGLYTIQLIATDSTGCRDTARREITVIGLKSGMNIPKPLYGCHDTVRLFDNSIVYDPYFEAYGKRSDSILPETGIPPNYPSGHFWEFGDGKWPSVLKNPVHDYVYGGKYAVSHQVTTYNMCKSGKTDTVRIDAPKPAFDFVGDSVGFIPFTVSFDNKSEGSTAYIWDFGDGTIFSTTSDTNVSRTYTVPGTYCVYLNAGNSQPGCIHLYPDTMPAFPNTATPRRCVVAKFHVGIAGVVQPGDVIKVYPNPAHEQLMVESVEEMKGLQVAIIDMMGRRYSGLPLVHSGAKSFEVPLHMLPRGTYVLEVLSNDKLTHVKFLKE